MCVECMREELLRAYGSYKIDFCCWNKPFLLHVSVCFWIRSFQYVTNVSLLEDTTNWGRISVKFVGGRSKYTEVNFVKKFLITASTFLL